MLTENTSDWCWPRSDMRSGKAYFRLIFESSQHVNYNPFTTIQVRLTHGACHKPASASAQRDQRPAFGTTISVSKQ